jgi:hypothetical protein
MYCLRQKLATKELLATMPFKNFDDMHTHNLSNKLFDNFMAMCINNMLSSIGSSHSQGQNNCDIDRNKEEKANEQCLLYLSRVDDGLYLLHIKICSHLLNVD